MDEMKALIAEYKANPNKNQFHYMKYARLVDDLLVEHERMSRIVAAAGKYVKAVTEFGGTVDKAKDYAVLMNNRETSKRELIAAVAKGELAKAGEEKK